MSIYDLVIRVARHFGFKTDNITVVKSDSLNQPAKRPPITGLDISKAKRELDFRPHDFETCLDIFEKQYKNVFG
jgi:dTDP-4-dehydrorhamnose reductase